MEWMGLVEFDMVIGFKELLIMVADVELAVRFNDRFGFLFGRIGLAERTSHDEAKKLVSDNKDRKSVRTSLKRRVCELFDLEFVLLSR
jgi:hypothetical protein